MSQKSIEALREQISSGKRLTKSLLIFRRLKEQCCTLDYLKDITGMKHQTLTARLSELCDAGMIYETGTGIFIVTPADKIELAAQRRLEERHKKWIKVGMENGWLTTEK